MNSKIKKSGATMKVGAPDNRIEMAVRLILTPRIDDLTPVVGSVVTARGKNTAQQPKLSMGVVKKTASTLG